MGFGIRAYGAMRIIQGITAGVGGLHGIQFAPDPHLPYGARTADPDLFDHLVCIEIPASDTFHGIVADSLVHKVFDPHHYRSRSF